MKLKPFFVCRECGRNTDEYAEQHKPLAWSAKKDSDLYCIGTLQPVFYQSDLELHFHIFEKIEGTPLHPDLVKIMNEGRKI